MTERWEHVADIIGADDVALDVKDLGEEGRFWARHRFGGEARYLVKVFDYLDANRLNGSRKERSPD